MQRFSWKVLVKKTESHVIILFLLFFLNLCCRSCSSKLAGVGEELLEHLSLLEGDLGDGSDGQEVLHTIGDAVRSRGNGWVANLQTYGSNIGDSGHELVLDVIISDVQDLGAEHGSLIIDLLDNQSVVEGEDLQHIEESGLGSSDLVTNLDDGDILDDFPM